MKAYKVTVYRSYNYTRYQVSRLYFGFLWWVIACDFDSREKANGYIKERERIDITVVR